MPDKNYLSIVVIIKNRTKFTVTHNKKTLTLKLFENNIDALFKSITAKDVWQLVVIDFDSTDVNMQDFLENKFKTNDKPNFTYTLHTIHEKFCKGKGLNIAHTFAKHDNLFFLDADMLITSSVLFDYGFGFLKKGKIYFPICMSYTGPDHVYNKPRPTGTGNVFITKKMLEKVAWGEHNKWGREDTDFYKIFEKRRISVRNNVDKTFFHQWHPNTIPWKNRFYR